MIFVIDQPFLIEAQKSDAEKTNSKVTIEEYLIKERTAQSENNMFTEIIKVDVVYSLDDELQKKAFIIKCPFNTFMYSALDENGVFEKEVLMYKSVLPQINQLLDLQITPHLYLVACEKVLVLQDLSYFGYRTENYRKKLTFEQSKIALERLAKFHAASYKLHQNNPDALVAVSKEVILTQNFLCRVVKTWCPIISCILKKGNFSPRQIQKLTSLQDEIIEKLPALLNGPVSKFTVLNHGDFRTTNILLKHDDDGKPIDSRLIDFQLCRWCSPTYDIIYFIITSIPFDTFEKCSEELFDTYLLTLNETLSKLDCKYEYLKEEFKKDLAKMKLVFVFIFLNLCITTGDPNCLQFSLSSIKEDEKTEASDPDIIDKIYEDEMLKSTLCKWFKYLFCSGFI